MNYAAARVKINGFDFDSTAPVNGNVLDEKYEQAKKELIHGTIGYLLAIIVVLSGMRLSQWWYYGGWHWMVKLFAKFGPGVLRLIQTGNPV